MTDLYQKNGNHIAESIMPNEVSHLNSIDQQLQLLRDRFLEIATEIRQAPDLETLVKVTAAQIREKINCDRAVIYRIHSPESGVVLAESVTRGWTPTIGETLPTMIFDLSSKENSGFIAFENIDEVQITPYQKQLLDKFQIKAGLALPIWLENRLWGRVFVNSCAASRQWQESELSLLSQVSTEISYKLQSFEFQKQLQQQQVQHKSVTKVIDKIHRSSNVDRIFQTTTVELRQILQCDRVGVYRFYPDWSGEFVAEAVGNEWVKLVGPGIKTVWEDTYLQETQGGRYRNYESFVVNDIYEVNHAPCHVDILEQFQVKAYVIVPVFAGKNLWGLLAAYQNSAPRNWHKWEVDLLTEFGVSFGLAVSQAEYIQQIQAQSEQLARTATSQQNLITLTQKIGEALIEKLADSSQLETILQATVQQVRYLLQVDRVVVYKFNPDWSGQFVAESVARTWTPFREQQFNQSSLQQNGDCDTIRNLGVIKDTYLQETKGGRYQKKTSCVVDDIYKANFPACYLELLEQFQTKAYLTVPIFKENKLWGLLASYQNTGPRHWEEVEVSVMNQIGVLLGVAMQQAEILGILQRQSIEAAKTAERDRTVAKIINKIRQSLDIESIFASTTKEVRSLLNADRVAVYRFHEDWSGKFVSESVGNDWISLVEKQQNIERLQESVSICTAMRSLIETSKQQQADTYMQSTSGGQLTGKKAYIVTDIYKTGFNECYIQVLEKYQAKAYAIVPIFQGQHLWGMLAAYQNSGSREWEEVEVNLLSQIAAQFGVGLQQAEYLQQLQAQSKEIQQVAEQKQLVSKIIERIRQSRDLDTLFKSTAKEVRRLLNSDRVGVYRFCVENGNFDEGEFIAEDVVGGYSSILGGRVKDHCFSKQYALDYQQGRIQAIADIYDASFSECHIEILAKLQIRANLIVPLLKGNQLWGFLCIHQCNGPREWQQQEIDLVKQITNQFGVALQQAEYLQQLEQQSVQVTEAAAREKAAKEVLQIGAMQLLAAVRPALNGDLTVRAPITEDELGTIADAYNNTLQALRQIVIQVQAAAQQVAQTSGDSNAALSGLTNLAQEQSQQIDEALGKIQEMVESTQAVVANADLVQIALNQANQTVNSGDVAMNLTVEAIQGIRETVAQTGKKIKCLSESSQKISKVVNLISNFATQTNVLALNAAIEATRAGEYGKGFAVVAEEVRSLSRQSAAATIEIEKLVQEIQSETAEVAVAMETGIEQVVEGTNLVNQTRQNLNAIVDSTAKISNLVQKITEANQGQILQTVSVTASMKDVANISSKTSAEANNIAVVFQELSQMALELLASASKFKVN